MSDPTDIRVPLSDRALTHGRNVMATASVILALAYVPAIDIKKFEAFGFSVKEGGELSIWALLSAVLVYYTLRFAVDCWTDYRGWKDTFRNQLVVKSDNPRYKRPENNHVRRLNRRFWWWDFGPPMLMSGAATFAVSRQIYSLLF